MALVVNNIFKLLSLRRPAHLTEEAITGVEPSELYNELDAINPDPSNPEEELSDIINRHPPLNQEEANNSLASALNEAIEQLSVCTVKELKALKVGRNTGEQLNLKELIIHNDFIKIMARLSDSWLAVQLGTALNNKKYPEGPIVDLTNAANIQLIEKLLKAFR